MAYNERGSSGSSYGGGGGYGRSGGYGGFGGRGGSDSGVPKPVKIGDELDVKIEAVAAKGDGIAKKDGFIIFVKDAKEGDSIKVRITEVRERFAVGEKIA
jgi:predicted RNA-binding protein with TRAM domain